MYECRYEFIPDDDYDKYISNIFRQVVVKNIIDAEIRLNITTPKP